MKNIESKFEKAVSPVQTFIDSQSSGGILLLLATVLALVVANSPLSNEYFAIQEWKLGMVFEGEVYSMSLHHWINDGLMVLLFFLLGLEIKRELLVGELSNIRRSSTVIAAAVGGMAVPALIYVFFNSDEDVFRGWGIPMATDTAFVLGLLALLSKKVPNAAKVFLVGVAIVDDIGAVLVIAFFYTEQLNLLMLSFATVLFFVLVAFNILGIRHVIPYVMISVLLWMTMYKGGIHGTVAGVLAAMTVPARPKKSPKSFASEARNLISKFAKREVDNSGSILESHKSHKIIEKVEKKAKLTSTPLQRWEVALENPVNLGIIPIFAFFNAGIIINTKLVNALTDSSVGLGVLLGLLIGKPIGIVVMTLVCIKMNIGELSKQLNLDHIIGIGILAGMGFTMSIFITNLGFKGNTEYLLSAKLGILIATFIAGVIGLAWMYFISFKGQKDAN